MKSLQIEGTPPRQLSLQQRVPCQVLIAVCIPTEPIQPLFVLVTTSTETLIMVNQVF